MLHAYLTFQMSKYCRTPKIKLIYNIYKVSPSFIIKGKRFARTLADAREAGCRCVVSKASVILCLCLHHLHHDRVWGFLSENKWGEGVLCRLGIGGG